MPHVFNAASPPQFSRSPSPFMPPFGAHYPPMMPPIPVPPGPSELSSDPSLNSEESKGTRADWNRDETSVLLEIWGALYDSLISASAAQKKKAVESNFKKNSRQVLRSGGVIKQKPGSTQEKNKEPGISIPSGENENGFHWRRGR